MNKATCCQVRRHEFDPWDPSGRRLGQRTMSYSHPLISTMHFQRRQINLKRKTFMSRRASSSVPGALTLHVKTYLNQNATLFVTLLFFFKPMKCHLILFCGNKTLNYSALPTPAAHSTTGNGAVRVWSLTLTDMSPC